jgi:hypothetical protein
MAFGTGSERHAGLGDRERNNLTQKQTRKAEEHSGNVACPLGGDSKHERLGSCEVRCSGYRNKLVLRGTIFVVLNTNLSSPAKSDNSPRFDGRILILNSLDKVRDPLNGLRRRTLILEKFSQRLLMLIIGRRIPREVSGLAVEKVRNEHVVSSLRISVGKNVGTLDGLGVKAKYISNVE